MAPLADAASIRSTITDLIAREEDAFLARQPRSAAMGERARRSLAGGATSSWMIARPGTVWISHGQGSKVYDLDGTEYVDLHAGYGVMLVGHAHPAVVEAVQRRVELGTHFAQPTEDAVDRGRGARPALRAAPVALLQLGHRGHDGRRPPDAGHHRARPHRQDRGQLPRPPRRRDGLDVQRRRRARPARAPAVGGRRRGGSRRPWSTSSLVVPFNDLEVLERVLTEHAGRVAGMIMEPLMMNAGIVPPAAGLPGGRPRAHPAPRRAAGLRRGQDRAHGRPRRRHRALRRAARHRVPGQGAWAAASPAAPSAARTR